MDARNDDSDIQPKDIKADLVLNGVVDMSSSVQFRETEMQYNPNLTAEEQIKQYTECLEKEALAIEAQEMQIKWEKYLATLSLEKWSLFFSGSSVLNPDLNTDEDSCGNKHTSESASKKIEGIGAQFDANMQMQTEKLQQIFQGLPAEVLLLLSSLPKTTEISTSQVPIKPIVPTTSNYYDSFPSCSKVFTEVSALSGTNNSFLNNEQTVGSSNTAVQKRNIKSCQVENAQFEGNLPSLIPPLSFNNPLASVFQNESKVNATKVSSADTTISYSTKFINSSTIVKTPSSPSSTQKSLSMDKVRKSLKFGEIKDIASVPTNISQKKGNSLLLSLLESPTLPVTFINPNGCKSYILPPETQVPSSYSAASSTAINKFSTSQQSKYAADKPPLLSNCLAANYKTAPPIYPSKTEDFKIFKTPSAEATKLNGNKLGLNASVNTGSSINSWENLPPLIYMNNSWQRFENDLNKSNRQSKQLQPVKLLPLRKLPAASKVIQKSSKHLMKNVESSIRESIIAEHSYAKRLDRNSSKSILKSPQRRELYEDLPRHRCSPNKSGRNKRREHMHDTHHKRERNERGESHKHSNVSSSPQTASRSHGVNIGVGGLLIPTGNNINISNSGNVVSTGVAGKNSPAINDVPVNANHTGLLTSGGNSVVGLPNGGNNSQSPSLDYLGPSSSNAVVVSQAEVSKILNDVQEKCSGYNSGDEYVPSKEKAVTAEEWKRRDEQFVHVMAELGYEVRQVEEDGACLFRAISLQIYGDEDAHDVIRQHTMDYIHKNREYFSHFVTEDIEDYITRKRRKDSHGNHIEIQAMSEIYSRPVEVYCYKLKPINIFNSEQQRNGYPPLRLSYQRWSHYNAIIDPYNATVGVGLGIANYHPQMQTKDATRMSEQLEIEQTMFEDKLKTTDWEATNEVIEEQVARESYLQWCRDNMQRNRAVVARSATATITSAQANANADISQLPCDEIASPSKYALNFNNNGSLGLSVAGSDGDNMLNPSSPIPTPTRKLNFIGIGEKQQCSTENNAGVNMVAGNASPGLASKKLNILTKHQELGNYDSDDTDSTNSSLNDNGNTGGGGVVSIGNDNTSNGNIGQPSPGRSKKMKTRLNNKKRRHEQLMRQKEKKEEILTAHRGGGDSPNSGGTNGVSGDAVPRMLKSIKRDISTTNSPINAADPGDSTEERPCSSKCMQQSSNGNAIQGDGTQSTTLSSFYQDLLESSYTTDGYGQLTEAEMLQRAIQMSTQDYIADQKRKYLYGP